MKKDNDYNTSWNLKRIKLATHSKCGFWFDTLYDFNTINDIILKDKIEHDKLNSYWGGKPIEMIDLDPDIWEEIVNTIESARKFIYETCLEHKVSEFESHFLSINWAISTLKKFRNKFFKSLATKIQSDHQGDYDRTQYDRAALQRAINILIARLNAMAIQEKYKWSKQAADGQLSYFRKQASWDIARELAEDTSAIIHTKLML